MKKSYYILFGLIAVTGFADDTAQQVVNMTISAISSISVSPSTVSMTISQTASGDITPATSSGTWEYVDNQSDNLKVTAAIDSTMPSNTTLSASMTAPTGGTSAGNVSLTSTAKNLVTGISRGSQSSIPLELTFDAESTAATGSFSRTITYTLTTGS